MVEAGLKAAGFDADPAVHETFTKYRKSHNDGVFDAYTPEIMNARRSGIITGLPDAYGRGRIIGDYRRVALYGVDRLLEVKREERAQIDDMWPTDEIIRQREELSEQMRALKDLAEMAKLYGHDISKPAMNAQEAFQWTYFAYLGAIKEANGAAMSIGRISTFLDIFIERDIKEGVLDEAGAQELWDQLVQKLRIVRFLRTPDYDALFSGDPFSRPDRRTWPRKSLRNQTRSHDGPLCGIDDQHRDASGGARRHEGQGSLDRVLDRLSVRRDWSDSLHLFHDALGQAQIPGEGTTLPYGRDFDRSRFVRPQA
jgi:hypothetical protein